LSVDGCASRQRERERSQGIASHTIEVAAYRPIIDDWHRYLDESARGESIIVDVMYTNGIYIYIHVA